MTNILIVEGGTGHGGSSSYLYGFLKYLDRTKFYPIVVFYNYADGQNINKIKQLGLRMMFLSNKKIGKPSASSQQENNNKSIRIIKYLSNFFKKDLPLIMKIISIIKQNKIELVFLNAEVHFHVPGVIAARIAGTKCAARKSGVGNDESRKIRGFLSRFVDLFIASCPAESNFHRENRWPSKKMVTIYEGVDMKDYELLPKLLKIYKEFGISKDAFLVGYISRLDSGKGQDDFIKAAQIVCAKIPNAFFLIVGDDVDSGSSSIKNQLQELAKKLRIEKNVIFTGWRTDIKDILRDIDIFVHCPNTWKEGMGVATLEALASGKPVVISDNWGLKETAKDGFNGFIVPIGDYEMLAQRIIELSLNQDLRNKMANNSRIFSEKNFDIAKNVKKIERNLESLLLII